MYFQERKSNVGKLTSTLDEAGPGVHEQSYRLFVTDKKTGLQFLIDTGANISVLPPRKGQLPKPLNFQLFAANNTTIPTYGEKTIEIDLKLRRPFKWTFIIAKVGKPIIGADFLEHHQLIVDIKNRKLIDGKTSFEATSFVRATNIPTVRSIDIQKSYHDILAEFPGTTRLTSMNLTEKNQNVEHFIETTGQPLHCRARPIPPHRYEQVRKEFQNMIEQGLCRPSKSPWSSPLHIVPKKNGDLRVCGDYRRLNAITIPDRYPIPRIKDFTFQLSNKKIFSTIDLNRAYQQIRVREEDIEKTAIITPMGLFECQRVCPGLKNAGQTFQRFIHEVLQGLDFVFAYIDDLLIASPDEETHKNHLRTILRRLEDNGITINPSKCVLGESEVKFLGFTVNQQGIKPPEEKVSAICNYIKPKTIEELRRFLGMINFYREHIPQAAQMQAPLHLYLHNAKKKDRSTINWTEAANKSFEACKVAIQNAALLAHPSHDATLAIFSDASDLSAGAVLQQFLNQKWQPLGYFSKKFSDAQRNYSTFDRELLAIYMAIKYFRKMFEGRNLIIFTDHKPLTYVLQKSPSASETPRRARQLIFISEFTTDIRHISGSQNIVADALSRVPVEIITCPTSLDYEKIAEEQERDKNNIDKLASQSNLSIKKIALPNSRKAIYCETSTSFARPYLPENFRRQAFDALHSISHPGIRTTRKLISEKFFWPSMNTEISTWAKQCIQCQRCKVQRHTSSDLSTFPPTERFQHVHIDIVGPLPTSPQGHRYLVTMIDRATRWAEAIPTDDTSAESIAKIFYENWIARFGSPRVVTSDQGRNFESRLFNKLLNTFGTERTRSSPYNPKANGMIERWHRSLKTSLKTRLSQHSTWIDELPTVLLGLRAAVRTDTGVSAAELTYGYNLRLPCDFFTTPSSSSPPPDQDMDSDFVSRLREFINAIKPSQQTLSHGNKRTLFVHEDLHTCKQVFIRNDAVKKPLQPTYDGPYTVLERNKKTFKLLLPERRSAVISIDRLKPAYTVNEDIHDNSSASQQDTTASPPSAIMTPAPTPTSSSTKNQPPILKKTRCGREIKYPVRFR